MTKREWDVLNSVCSQLQHYIDHDMLWASVYNNGELLDEAMRILDDNRGRLIQERDYGHQQTRN